MSPVVVKGGTSSLTSENGHPADDALRKLCAEVAAARALGHVVVLVSSGAIATGLPVLGFQERPDDIGVLQALAAVGQPRLMERFASALAAHDLVAGQVLLTAH